MTVSLNNVSDRVDRIQPSLTMSITAMAARLRSEGKNVIGFGAGEPDFDTFEPIKAAAIRAIESGKSKYTPAGGLLELKEAISQRLMTDYRLDYSPSNIVVSCGAKHSLHNVFLALLNPGDEVIVPSPYWVSYPEQIALAGGRMVTVATTVDRDFKLTPDDLEAVITPKTTAIVMNSPSNPTGCVYSESELRAIGEWAVARGLWIVSDEIYDKLIYDHPHVSIPTLSPEIKERTVLVNGVSKSYAMTGWRVGYFAAPTPIAAAVSRLQSHTTSNPTSIAQYAAIEAFSMDQSPLDAVKQTFRKRRDVMVDHLSAIPGVVMNQPQGAFYAFPKISGLYGRTTPKGMVVTDSISFCEQLLDDTGVACVPGIGFGADDFMRLSYATSEDHIHDGISRIQSWVASLT